MISVGSLTNLSTAGVRSAGGEIVDACRITGARETEEKYPGILNANVDIEKVLTIVKIDLIIDMVIIT